jgi:hypothetical protein
VTAITRALLPSTARLEIQTWHTERYPWLRQIRPFRADNRHEINQVELRQGASVISNTTRPVNAEYIAAVGTFIEWMWGPICEV